MAQRVCLIPWHPRHVAVVRALLNGDAAEQARARDGVLPTARLRHMLDRVSAAYGARLKPAEMAKAGLDDLFAKATVLRPYVACVTSAQAAVAVVDALSRCADQAAASVVFNQQLLLLDRAMVSPEMPEVAPDRLDEMWADIPKEIERLRLFHKLVKAGKPYETKRQKTIKTAEGQVSVLVGEWEPYTMPVTELPGQYGFSLGWVLGRLCALTMPTWWQGRNIWLGRMCEWGSTPEMPEPVRTMAKQIQALTKPVHELLADMGIPGFEEGLPAGTPTYTVSCHVPPENVGKLLDLVTADRAAWTAFVAKGSGYPTNQVVAVAAMHEEACLWAMRQGCGLMEGDDLVERVF